MKKWLIHQPPEEAARNIKLGSDLSMLCAQVLASRGMQNVQEAADFLQCDRLGDPFLTADMQEAADRINQALEEGTRICIYGDYDCDGVTATVMLYSYLLEMGANVTYRIPERDEGYGLNADAVHEMHQDGVKMIITVDNGITALEEAELICSLGMTLIITDHHQPLEKLPAAAAIVDPHRVDDTSPYHNLCGAGVVLKLIAALDGDDTMAMEQFGELAAIATIADVVELSGENRYLVQMGLQLLANTERPGLLALLDKSGLSGKPFTSSSIAFGVAPRINAAGRFGSPDTAVKLLLSEDPEEAAALADELEQRNQARKAEEVKILQEIAGQTAEHPELLKQRVLVCAGENWHHGVIGIAASRLQEQFGKPTILITIEGDRARGSMRSFGSFSAFRCLDACKELLTRYGGHPGAGGFSMESSQTEAFCAAVQAYALAEFSEMPVMTLEADRLLLPHEMTIDNIAGLSLLAPFGEGNPVPVFALCHAVLHEIVPLSKGVHSKLRITYGGTAMDLLLFRVKPDEVSLKPGTVCDFLVTAEAGSFQGRPQLTLIVKDYRKSGLKQAKYFAARNTYERFCRDESLSAAFYQAITPTREVLVQIYQRIPETDLSFDGLFCTLQDLPQMNYCKMRLALDIFSELGLVQQNLWTEQVHRNRVQKKVDLQASVLLQGLQEKERM
ncbi:single-stranded-DNA-specific exonuclease RecJ [Ruminococcus sp.]|uniref:single-stranded-DNA-specific exonuclease RecJ n=1 Tax=Ruminococcus sp. TaxID=41978 RepID=UPI0025FDF1B3|nr:single-stranded-DNA-specific exonuclease RecJ [Ruminococcus sp.]